MVTGQQSCIQGHLCIPIKLPELLPPSLFTLVNPLLMAWVILKLELWILVINFEDKCPSFRLTLCV